MTRQKEKMGRRKKAHSNNRRNNNNNNGKYSNTNKVEGATKHQKMNGISKGNIVMNGIDRPKGDEYPVVSCFTLFQFSYRFNNQFTNSFLSNKLQYSG